MRAVYLILVFGLTIVSEIGEAMKPYRPELMVFVSPDKKQELHSPIYKKSFLVKLKTLKNERVDWPDNMNVDYMFSDPSQPRIITVGGLGDAGVDLGRVVFYAMDGSSKIIDLKTSIPNLEELSRSYRDFSNFPWITGIDFSDSDLVLWVCDKVQVKIAFKDLKVHTESLAKAPAWAVDAAKDVLSARAKKQQWQMREEGN